MIARIGPVTEVADTGDDDRERLPQPADPGGRHERAQVQAATLNLLPAVGATVAQGSYLNAATATEPVCVLGAQRRSCSASTASTRPAGLARRHVVLRHRHPQPAALAPEIEAASSSASPPPRSTSALDGHPTTIYGAHRHHHGAPDRSRPVRDSPRTANPETPNEVDVSQPSAALTARADAQGALNGLFLGLGAVSLLVGAVGVANIMIISVLERRSEIGLRRALGATKGNIRTQFLSEAILLALGGVRRRRTRDLATAVYAHTKHWATVIPTLAWAGGLAAAFAIGAIAGLLPAIRAARLAPTDALRTG